MSVVSPINWKIKCFRELPITFRIPISFSLREEIATAVLVRLKQAMSSTKIPIIPIPTTAAMGEPSRVQVRRSFRITVADSHTFHRIEFKFFNDKILADLIVVFSVGNHL